MTRWPLLVAASLAGVLALASCSSSPRPSTSPSQLELALVADPGNPVLEVLASHPGLGPVVADSEKFRLQIVLGLIEPGTAGPQLVQHGYRLDAEYFYPASALKLFAAVAVAEWLGSERENTGLPLGFDTRMVFSPLFYGEVLQDRDPTNIAGGHITIGHEIRKLFLVSDNEAFNRLYELVGQDGLAASLARAGLERPRVVHRLAESRSDEDNRRVPQIDLSGPDFRVVLRHRTSEPLPPREPVSGLQFGDAYLSGGAKVEGPMDFSGKNYFPLADLQRGLCMVTRPEVDCGGPGFSLGEAERAFLLEAMSEYPSRSPNPRFDATEYPDSWGKFLLPGLARVLEAERLQIFNKVGGAYGFTVENALVVDRETGRSFFLAATLYTNADGILNDDVYEYTTVARPFLADLGEALARRYFVDAPRQQ